MNYKTFLITIFGLFFVSFTPELFAAIQQPSFVTGDGERAIQDAGGRLYGIVSGIVAIISAITGMVGAAFFAVGKPDDGKRLLIGAGIGLILAGSVSILYYIAG